MVKILIVCVNYNSYPELRNYLSSIETSLVTNSLSCRVDVWVADNSSEKEVVDTTQYKHICVQVKSLNNLGYLGGAAAVINNLPNLADYDFVIISNVDILFTDTTIAGIVKKQVSSDVLWLSPRLYSIKYGVNLHVEKRYRPSKRKMYLYRFLYQYPLLRRVQHYFAVRKYKNENYMNSSLDVEIYSGCGSCFILTKEYFRVFPKLNYPLFLYGEEMYLAELIHSVNRKVIYCPMICIQVIGGVSTGNLKSSSFYRYNYDAVKYIYDRFYKKISKA